MRWTFVTQLKSIWTKMNISNDMDYFETWDKDLELNLILNHIIFTIFILIILGVNIFFGFDMYMSFQV